MTFKELVEKYEAALIEVKKIYNYNLNCFEEFEASEEKDDLGRRVTFIAVLNENKNSVEWVQRIVNDLKRVQEGEKQNA